MKTFLPIILIVLSIQLNAQEVVDLSQTSKSSALYGEGSFCLEMNDFICAKKNFKEAIAYYAKNSDYYYGLGLAHFYLEELDSAYHMLKKSIALDPNQANYHYYTGAVFYKLQNYRNSSGAYIKALEVNPKSDIKIDVLNTKFHIGVCHMKLNHHWDAIDVFSEILEEDPSNHKALLNRGISLAMENKLDRACSDFTRSARRGNDRAKSFLEKYCYGSRIVVVKN